MPIETGSPGLQPLPVEQIESRIRERTRDRRVVLVQCGNEPVVHPRHRDLARVQLVNDLPPRLAAVVNLEGLAVRFVLHDDPAAAILERVRQSAQLLNAIGLVINGTDDGESRVERTENVRERDLVEEVDEQISRGRAAVDYKQIGSLRGREHAIDLAPVFKINELRLRMESLQRRVLVVAVDHATGDAAIFEILNEVRGEEAFSDAAFAVDDEIDLFVHKKLR